MRKHNTVCAGIDTGKRKLDVALAESPHRLQVDNNCDGHTALSAWLRKHRVKRAGIEASGGYEQAAVAKLRRDGFVVIVFQPAQVRAYAKFHLQRSSRPEEFHLRALPEPGVNLSIHPARDVRPLP